MHSHRNRPQTLTGIETQYPSLHSTKLFIEIDLKPLQGLKQPRSIVGYSRRMIEIDLKPLQGLKLRLLTVCYPLHRVDRNRPQTLTGIETAA